MIEAVRTSQTGYEWKMENWNWVFVWPFWLSNLISKGGWKLN